MQKSIPWIEKYRPVELEEIVLSKNITQQLHMFIESNAHLILTGMPGIGKTTAVRCLAKMILGDNMEQGYLELNAGEERGVGGIAKIVPPFCQRLWNVPKPKIILFDEADNMTAKCQHDINELIKRFGHKTMFIFTCNDSQQIIEDIQSVCRIVRFARLDNVQIKEYLINICTKEDVPYNEKGLDLITDFSEGDMRRAINDLQITAFSFDKVTKSTVLKICKKPDPEQILNVIELCRQKDLMQALAVMKEVIGEGYYYLDIVSAFHTVLIKMDMEEGERITLFDIVNQAKISISGGLRTKLQLEAMCCRLVRNYLD